MASLYETDYYGWTQQVVAALREGRLHGLVLEEIAEEIEDLGKSERRTLQSALKQLLQHLLKWDYQPERRSRSWSASIQKQRLLALEIVNENPSLRPLLSDPDFISHTYTLAVLDALIEADLPRGTFPSKCPYSLQEMFEAEREFEER